MKKWKCRIVNQKLLSKFRSNMTRIVLGSKLLTSVCNQWLT